MNHLLNKKILFKIGSDNLLPSVQRCLTEGVVEEVNGNVVKIGGNWYESKDVSVVKVLGSINESGNGGKTLING